MKRFVICDKRADFLHDVQMRALLDERECTITEIIDGNKFRELEGNFSGQRIIMCDNMLEDLSEDFEKGFAPNQVIGYCVTNEGREKFEVKGIECIGSIHSSAQLLSMLLGMPEERADSWSESRVREDFSSWKERLHQKTVEENLDDNSREEPGSRVSSILELREARVKREAERLLRKEQMKLSAPQSAVSIVVTSTKGGVGKTTVATQLACCIALTSQGRGRFKACIVDFDTGFGDVCTALDYSTKGPTITAWIDDIRQRMRSGEKKEDIIYTEEQIQEFLQKKEDTGLYALLAPQIHTDSLDISTDELEIIMGNLKERAGLDYVIYDTGNDLKDPTLLALDQAEYVLLVATQDISCAHCLDMFLRTLETIRFDTSKIKLVINNIMSAKATGISIAELQESFKYPCWAKIKHDAEIIRCNNFGRPVVFSAAHDMTKQMRSIIQRLNEHDGTLQAEEPKKSFWKKLFSAKEGK